MADAAFVVAVKAPGFSSINGTDIISDRDVTAVRDVTATHDVKATNNMSAGVDQSIGRDLHVVRDAKVDHNLTVLGALTAASFQISGGGPFVLTMQWYSVTGMPAATDGRVVLVYDADASTGPISGFAGNIKTMAAALGGTWWAV
jgi:hypothetical protein